MKTAEYVNSFGETVELYEGPNGNVTVVDGVITVYDKLARPLGEQYFLDEALDQIS